jgi:hypothetical protein
MKALLADDAVSRLGVVGCFFCMDNPFEIPKETMEVTSNSQRVVDSLPFRFASIHYCYDSPLIRSVIGLIAMILSQYHRVRFSPCYGSTMECLYDLQRFGIPRKIIPLDDDGNLIPDSFYAYIQSCKTKEVVTFSDDSNNMISFPSRRDVLLGRGVPYQDWMGNVELMKSVDLYLHEYQSSTERGRKSEICKEIVASIHAQGGRFIRRSDGGMGDDWEEVSVPEAVEKLGHLFRNRSRKVSSGQERANAFSNFWDYVSSTSFADGATKKQKRQRIISTSYDDSSYTAETPSFVV